MKKEVKSCDCDCGKPACFFHTKCCNAHMEGEVINGDYYVVCEKCKKMVGKLIPIKEKDVKEDNNETIT